VIRDFPGAGVPAGSAGAGVFPRILDLLR